jgi:hypothetical protein
MLVAPALPQLGGGADRAILVAGSTGLCVVALASYSVVPLVRTPALAALVLLGAGLVAAVLNAGNVGALASPAEAVALAAVGVLFVRLVDLPAAALGVPLLVAGIDIASVALDGPSTSIIGEGITEPGDPLTLGLPDWGTGLPAGRLGFADPVFLGAFGAWAWTLDLRVGAAFAGMALGLVGTAAINVATDATIPALPLIVAGYLVPNADRFVALFRAPPPGAAPGVT